METPNLETWFFTNSEKETLSLDKILKSKKITSITLKYVIDEMIEMGGFFGWFGFKKQTKEKKEVTINCERINFHFQASAKLDTVITFSSEAEFEKIPEDSYNVNTLWKQKLENYRNPYMIEFCMENLKEINWVDN